MNKENSALLIQKLLVEHCVGEIPENSNKKIFYVMRGDGIWQVRKNDIGLFYFHECKANIPGLPKGFKHVWELNVPLIPTCLLHSAISFFRAIYKEHKSEVFIQFFYDTKKEEYIIYCPKQKVSGAFVNYENDDSFNNSNKILVLEMHSHGNMKAFFSTVDDKDEKADRFFGVIGDIQKYHPDTKFRLSIGKNRMDVELGDIFDIKPEVESKDFPEEWMKRVKKQKTITFGSGNWKQRFSPTRNKALPFFVFDDDEMIDLEMEKYFSGDYLYPNDCIVPEQKQETIETKTDTKREQAKVEIESDQPFNQRGLMPILWRRDKKF